uniref:RAB3GAP2_N domain-containing protein n=1 Tax=Mesocestoides corti TaxID=53468 RepID=A0A5K3FZF3_MESCO
VKNRSCVGEGWKLSAIAVWFEAENRTIEEEEELGGRGRVDIAKDLVASVDLSKVGAEQFVDFTTSECWRTLSKEFRDLVVNRWKESRRRLPPKDYLMAFSMSNRKLSFVTFEWTTEDGMRVVTDASTCDGQTDVMLRRIVPAHENCTVVALGDSIYLIGGRDETDVETNRVDRVDAFDGRVSSVAAMTQARADCACAAAGSQQLFVFGGIERGSGALASCEKFDPATNRQVNVGLKGSGRIVWV